ncbi:hypothetical protein USB125703_01411 [Pseudoclavibacter triregionum]|nr:hypothetical protein USB125703_01411 [Pseudoclavibacter triregionum]
MISAVAPCPCGSGERYGACCGPLHDGESAPTAERLMRSRFSAYALDLGGYVFRTWHPRTRPADVPTDGVTWRSLEILATEDGGPGDETGIVEFLARGETTDGPFAMRERSRFARRGGRWVYVDGEVDER